MLVFAQSRLIAAVRKPDQVIQRRSRPAEKVHVQRSAHLASQKSLGTVEEQPERALAERGASRRIRGIREAMVGFSVLLLFRPFT